MTINGINGANTQMGQIGMNQATDSYSRNIQNQIADAQKQLQELSSNKDMTQEEKMTKRQELQQQISDLNMQLRQHQAEQRREKQQKQSSFDDMIGGKQNTGTEDTGVIISLIDGVISIQMLRSPDVTRELLLSYFSFSLQDDLKKSLQDLKLNSSEPLDRKEIEKLLSSLSR